MADSIREAFEKAGLISEPNSRPADDGNASEEKSDDAIAEAFARVGLIRGGGG